MIALHLTVPIACWRKAHARELMETELLPPPATCYGALLALVGEVDRERHIGCRVTSGLLKNPDVSTVLRTIWRVKTRRTPQGNGKNARPDFQQLVVDSDLVIWCDSAQEATSTTLEARVCAAVKDPAQVERFGAWSLGESTHMINDAKLLATPEPPTVARVFLQERGGRVTLPVWVDHVGTAGTRYAVGTIRPITTAPRPDQIPTIAP
jgi:CRISPR-associated protein Cas5t